MGSSIYYIIKILAISDTPSPSSSKVIRPQPPSSPLMTSSSNFKFAMRVVSIEYEAHNEVGGRKRKEIQIVNAIAN
jgi:hypothetical protein